jgi:hypothetical protein
MAILHYKEIKVQIGSSSLGLIPQCFLCSELHMPEGSELHLRSHSRLCVMTRPEGLYKHHMSQCELGLLADPYPSVQFRTRLQVPQDLHCQPSLPHINNPFWPSASASCQVHIYSAIQTYAVWNTLQLTIMRSWRNRRNRICSLDNDSKILFLYIAFYITLTFTSELVLIITALCDFSQFMQKWFRPILLTFIYNGPTNALFCNKTLIQMSHTKTFKISPTCFDHQMIIIRELFDPS